MHSPSGRYLGYFYPRPPRGGRHAPLILIGGNIMISIHALREEGDRITSFRALIFIGFLSTPSARRATLKNKWEASNNFISIHALREEGDRHDHTYQQGLEHFYPRPPRGGRLLIFCINDIVKQDFYPRPPRGGRHSVCSEWQCVDAISIHALREEGDFDNDIDKFIASFDFYPRPPRGGRQRATTSPKSNQNISIHALREEGDLRPSCLRRLQRGYFYPRPPRGGRL